MKSTKTKTVSSNINYDDEETINKQYAQYEKRNIRCMRQHEIETAMLKAQISALKSALLVDEGRDKQRMQLQLSMAHVKARIKNVRRYITSAEKAIHRPTIASEKVLLSVTSLKREEANMCLLYEDLQSQLVKHCKTTREAQREIQKDMQQKLEQARIELVQLTENLGKPRTSF